MLDSTPSAERLAELRTARRSTRDKREGDRIKAVVPLGSGWSAEHVAEVLLIDPDRVRSHFKRYRQGGLEALGEVALRGSDRLLDAGQLALLDLHLKTHRYPTAKAIVAWVEETFGVSYIESGKGDAGAQKAFLVEYEELKRNKGTDDVVHFTDATHPQHNPGLGRGWIQRGQDQEVFSNGGERRLGLADAIDVDRLEPAAERPTRRVRRTVIGRGNPARGLVAAASC